MSLLSLEHLEDVDEIERRLERLRIFYEQYFQGVQKRPPVFQRQEVARIVNQVNMGHIRNTAHKFRVRSIIQKFNTYQTYWNRLTRQIEDGTYMRDRMKARRNLAANNQQAPDSSATTPKSEPAAAKAETPKDQLPKERLEQIHKELIQARQSLNLPSDISCNALSDRLNKQLPLLQKKLNTTHLDFKVVIKDGKVLLKPVPGKG